MQDLNTLNEPAVLHLDREPRGLLRSIQVYGVEASMAGNDLDVIALPPTTTASTTISGQLVENAPAGRAYFSRRVPVLGGAMSSMGWEVHGRGLADLIHRLHEGYGSQAICITETARPSTTKLPRTARSRITDASPTSKSIFRRLPAPLRRECRSRSTSPGCGSRTSSGRTARRSGSAWCGSITRPRPGRPKLVAASTQTSQPSRGGAPERTGECASPLFLLTWSEIV